MAASSSLADYLDSSKRTASHPKYPSTGVSAPPASSGSPRTPLLGRSISSQFGSPSAYRNEQEDVIIYELGARHLSAGFAGESQPRCSVPFNPNRDRRIGDYRTCDPMYRRKRRKVGDDDRWAEGHELYRIDLRTVGLGLVEDRLEQAVRTIQIDHLQLDQKPRKAVLVVPSLFPTPVLEIALKVLFNYSTQPPSILILTTPLLECVAAGLRNALVVEIGWEETVVTAVGEYKEVFQRRSVRAGKMLTKETARLLEEEIQNQHDIESNDKEGSVEGTVDLEYAEDVTRRMIWCRSSPGASSEGEQSGMVKLPLPELDAGTQNHIHLPFTRLSKPADTTFFPALDGSDDDNHSAPIHNLAYQVLLALPLDLRAICVSRIVIAGGSSTLPGLKQRLLQEITTLIETRGWDPVNNYGSATAHHDRVLQERSSNVIRHRQQAETQVPLSPTKKPIQESVPHSDRIHDDKYDSITQKAEREAGKGKTEMVKGVLRGVETIGAWAGASLVAGLRVKGVHEVEREEFLKHGYRDDGRIM